MLELGHHLFHPRHVAGGGVEYLTDASAARNGEFNALRSAFELVKHAAGLFPADILDPLHQLQQVCARRKWRLCLPQDECLETGFGLGHRAQDTVQHLIADGMHLGLEAENRDSVSHVPHAQIIGLEHGLAVLRHLTQ